MLAIACESGTRGAGDAMPDDDDWVRPDSPPPSVDAGPPPLVTCSEPKGNPHVDAGVQCPLPASVCLDEIYLVYYTGGTCVDGVCQFETNLMGCDLQCVSYSDPSYGGGCLQAPT